MIDLFIQMIKVRDVENTKILFSKEDNVGSNNTQNVRVNSRIQF